MIVAYTTQKNALIMFCAFADMTTSCWYYRRDYICIAFLVHMALIFGVFLSAYGAFNLTARSAGIYFLRRRKKSQVYVDVLSTSTSKMFWVDVDDVCGDIY